MLRSWFQCKDLVHLIKLFGGETGLYASSHIHWFGQTNMWKCRVRDLDFLLYSDSLVEMEELMLHGNHESLSYVACSQRKGQWWSCTPNQCNPNQTIQAFLQPTHDQKDPEPLPTLRLSSSSWENSIEATDSTCPLQCMGLREKKRAMFWPMSF